MQPEEPRDDEAKLNGEGNHAQRVGSMPELTDERDHHALHLQVFQRDEIGITRIFRFKKITPALLDETFQCRLAVDEGRDDRTGTRFPTFQNHQIPFVDIRTGHRITTHLQRKNLPSLLHPERLDIDGNGAFIFLRNGFSEARRSGSSLSVKIPRLERGSRP